MRGWNALSELAILEARKFLLPRQICNFEAVESRDVLVFLGSFGSNLISGRVTNVFKLGIRLDAKFFEVVDQLAGQWRTRE